MEYLALKKSNCRNCHKCIRNCPVKAIRFTGSQAYINHDECILCGHCFVACPQNAKQVVSELDKVYTLLKGQEPVIVSLAPSFAAKYAGVGIESMTRALRQVGFADVEETALGATLVKREYDRMINEGGQDIIITSCCHSVNLLIQKYFPSLLSYLADVLSPMQAHCQDIKRRMPNAKTVFIGPCIAKKDEAARYPGLVDAVLTFDELAMMLETANIVPEKEIIYSTEGKARFFPIPGGVLKTMEKANPKYTYMSIDGAENCIMALEDIRDGNIHNCFVEMNICAGSCIGGPVMEKHAHAPIREGIAIDRYAGENDFAIAQPAPDALRKAFPVINRMQYLPSESQITDALRAMGKRTKADELNCGTCGYNTCREKAIAICQGKAEVSMCLPFLMARSESFSETIIRNVPTGLIVVNEALEVQQINQAALTLLGQKNASAVMGEDISSYMDPAGIVEVLTTGRGFRDRPVYLQERDLYLSTTVVYDRESKVLVCILRDITRETKEHERKQRQNQQTVEVADRVIDHQMRIVQEIASLLGETAAETKIALTKLKESIDNE